MRKAPRDLMLLLGALYFAPIAVYADQSGNRSVVCVQVNAESGQCEYWQEVTQPPPQPRDNSYSYENDYRLPPPEARVTARPSAALGSGLMPGTDYAPGFGTAHKPIFEK